MEPLLSVFIPVRNDAAWLPSAVESVRAQSEGDWELVIGDNASSDDPASVTPGDDPRIRIVRWEEGVDVVASFNRTAAQCRGRWLVPLGADDRLLPEALRRFATAIADRPDLVMVVAACQRLDQFGHPAAATWAFYQGLARLRGGDYDRLGWIEAVTAEGQPPWNLGSIAFRRETVERLGGLFDERAGPASDIELVMRMAIGGPVRYLEEPALIFTQRVESDHRRQQRSNRVDTSSETILGRGLRAGVANMERRAGHLQRREREAIHAAIARSYIQRAAQHRLLPGGRGRRGAWSDVRRAWREHARTLLASRQAAFAAGALLTPSWMLRAAERLLRQERA